MSSSIVSSNGELRQFMRECKELGIKKVEIRVPNGAAIKSSIEVDCCGFVLVYKIYETNYSVMTFEFND